MSPPAYRISQDNWFVGAPPNRPKLPGIGFDAGVGGLLRVARKPRPWSQDSFYYPSVIWKYPRPSEFSDDASLHDGLSPNIVWKI